MESQQRIDELESKVSYFESIESEKASLSKRLSQLEAELIREAVEKDSALKALNSIESDKDRLDQQYSDVARLLDGQMHGIEEKRRELEDREEELEKERAKYKEEMEEEKQRIVENEIKEIDILKNNLQNRENALKEEKRETELKKTEITEKLEQITDVIAGKSIRFVTGEDAQLYELNYIARFDSKMHEFPIRIHNPIEDKNYRIKSWENHTRMSAGVGGDATGPENPRSVYVVEERKYKLFGEKVKKIVIEAVSFSHLGEYNGYSFDTGRVALSEFLSILRDSISDAELGQYLHVIGIASPTGWDERVVSEVQSKEFAHNYVSRFVSVCLVDSVTGEIYYNPADERITAFSEFFRPEFDHEKVEKVKRFVTERFSLKDYVLIEDAVEGTGEARDIVHRAISSLVDAGGYRMRWIEDVGAVVEIAR